MGEYDTELSKIVAELNRAAPGLPPRAGPARHAARQRQPGAGFGTAPGSGGRPEPVAAFAGAGAVGGVAGEEVGGPGLPARGPGPLPHQHSRSEEHTSE